MNAHLPPTHDGPAPLAVRGLCAPRLLRGPGLGCMAHGGGGGARTTQTQTTATTDNRVAVEGDGNQTYHGNSVSGDLTVISADAEVASDALDAAQGITQTGADTTLALARGALEGLTKLLFSNQEVSSGAFDLVARANASSADNARAVANSQKEFLRAQTGQDSVVKIIGYAIGAATVGGIVFALASNSKSK